jgi:hypothetical protein
VNTAAPAPIAQRAACIDAAFLRILRRGRFRARVHSVFERVVNIEHDSGELFSLACRGVDNAPSTAILDLQGFGEAGIAVGDVVAGDAQGMQIGDRLSIALAAVSPWDCTLPPWPADVANLRANLRSLPTRLECLGAAGGMLAPHAPASAFEAAANALLERHAAGVANALSRADFASACRHAKGMFGLGPGLTPSGDDFLVGLFAVLNIPGSPCLGWLGGGAEVLAGEGRSTNAISLAALSQAARGRVRESIAALIEHLLHGPPERLVIPLQRVLSIGSTSGTDIVTGIRCGLELNVSHEGTAPCQ